MDAGGGGGGGGISSAGGGGGGGGIEDFKSDVKKVIYVFFLSMLIIHPFPWKIMLKIVFFFLLPGQAGDEGPEGQEARLHRREIQRDVLLPRAGKRQVLKDTLF